MVEEIDVEKMHFPVYYLQIILNILGSNITFSAMKGSFKRCKLLFGILFHVWNFINIVQVVISIFLIVKVRRLDGSIKLVLSHFFQAVCSLFNIIFLHMKRDKLKELLINVNTLKSLTSLSRKRFKYMAKFTALYIQIFSILCIGFFITSLSPEKKIDKIASGNPDKKGNAPFKIFLPTVIFIFYYMNIAFPSLLTLIYIMS